MEMNEKPTPEAMKRAIYELELKLLHNQKCGNWIIVGVDEKGVQFQIRYRDFIKKNLDEVM